MTELPEIKPVLPIFSASEWHVVAEENTGNVLSFVMSNFIFIL